ASTFPFLEPVIQLPREQPTNTEHIDRRAHGTIAETVFASAKFSRAMIDWNFDEAITGAFNEGGNKTMHAFERDEGADAFAPHRFQGAAGIANAVPGESAADKVRDAAGQAFHHRVFALRTVAADEVRAPLDFAQQF